MIANWAADNHRVAGLRIRGGDRNPIGNQPYSGGGDEQLVGATAIDHLRVAGHDRDTGVRSGLRHRVHHPLQVP